MIFRHWTDYVDFFASEVKQLGVDGAVNKYFFLPELFGRFSSGIFHAIIHLGFGVEFNEPLIVAEGLALAALEQNLEFLLHLPPPSATTTPLRDIFEQVHNDKRFDEFIKPGEPDDRFHGVFATKSLLNEYISKWDVKGTESDVAAKEKELFETIVLLYAASTRPGKRPIFDFFIMHSLTSSVFVHLLSKHFPSEKGAQILRAHFVVTLMFYVASGRPKLYVDHLKGYTPKLATSPNPWLEIVKFGLETNDVHATKVAYSLLQGEAWFGDFDGILLKAAQITADAARAQPNSGIFQEKSVEPCWAWLGQLVGGARPQTDVYLKLFIVYPS